VSGSDRSTNWLTVTIAQLEEWEGHGAMWRAVQVSDERAVIDLCSCTGEPMERVQSEAPELIEYVRAHPDH
jgi:prephenate dehydrogenase